MISMQLCSVGYGSLPSGLAVKRFDRVPLNAADGEKGRELHKDNLCTVQNFDIF